MASFVKVILIGNLGRDAEMKYSQQGSPLLEFSIAVNEALRGRTVSGNEKTDWYRVTLWGKQAETLKTYLLKGKQVFVDGRLRIRDYVDREGKNRYSLEVTADNVQLLGGRVDQAGGLEGEASQVPGTDEQIQDGDIPF